MDVSIASERGPAAPLKALGLLAGGVAVGAVVVAAAALVLRWGSGAIDPRSAGGFAAVSGSTLVLTAAAIAALRPLRPRFPSRAGRRDSQAEPPAAAERAVSSMPSPSPWPGSKLVQRIERYERQTSDGTVAEAAAGRVVVRFAEGSRSAVAHVGFCPPFAATPRISVSNACDGVEVDVTAAEVLPWGVRIECRLEEPSEEPLDVDVDIVAGPADSR